MLFKKTLLASVISLSLAACGGKTTTKETPKTENNPTENTNFQYGSEQFADLKILRYKIDGFEALTPKQKELSYYLYQAALSGRDIIWDQNCKYNLTVRKTLENICTTYKGDKNTDEYKKFLVYAKRVFFSKGLHHHYSSNKIQPEFSANYLADLIKNADEKGFPKKASLDEFIKEITPIICDPTIVPKQVNLDAKNDLLKASATNFYAGVTQQEAENFYAALTAKKEKQAPMYGLNSQLTKIDGKVVEKVWKIGGMYSAAIEKIVFWLKKAVEVAENDQQKKTLELLVKYYETGDLKTFDDYNIEWVKDLHSVIDVVNGFIEVYGDPIGKKGSFESVVSIKDMEATKRIQAISDQAQWFEDNAPLKPEHKKKNVKGISAKVITVIVEGGDAAPATPIGINLPNNEWIRETHGSKSVSLGNIVHAYNEADKGGGMIDEFYANPELKERAKKYLSLSKDLHTDMHECIGHASGKINEGIGQPSETLKNHASTLEEARADLVALYYIYDKKLVEMGTMPSLEVGKAQYDNYISNGLQMQLVRLPLNEHQLEEAHMRNRQIVAAWVYEKGQKDKVIEKIEKDGKLFFVVNDYDKLKVLFGDLLREIQRIKSEGDFKAGQALVENYGVKVDDAVHKDAIARFEKLKIAPYKGFIQPKLVPVMDGDKIKDVKVEYPTDFLEQVLYYGKEYSFLPVNN